MTALLDPLLKPWADKIDFEKAHDFVESHYEIPVISVLLYLCVVHIGPRVVKTPLNFKLFNSLWNISIATFSLVGAMYCWPRLIELLTAKEISNLHPTAKNYAYAYGNALNDPKTWSPAFKRNVFKKPNGTYALQGSWDTAVCVYRDDHYRRGVLGLMNIAFMYSKIPELIDTFLLVVHKKPIIFLHWFHHTTVLLFCWHGWTQPSMTLLWTAAINFSVHAFMYTYYFLASINVRSILKPIAPWITIAQIVQMIIGVAYMSYAIYHDLVSGKGCDTEWIHGQLFLWMFVSYGILFSNFFLQRYVFKKPKKGGNKAE